VSEVFWDSSNHLYAISPAAGKLWVFTATPTSVKPAPGSPYSITSPQSLVVLPK
jgi:outer membrane protein assembly factor BamB